MFGKVPNTTLHKLIIVCNQFKPNVPFLDPLKTLESHRFSNIFRGYRDGSVG